MKRLDETVLKVGDVVLTTTTAAVSKTTRTATRSDISHAMIYVEDRSVIDATAEGVQARNTQRLFFEDGCAVHVLRLRDGLTAEQARGICAFVRGRGGSVGVWGGGLFFFFFVRGPPFPPRFSCNARWCRLIFL